MDKAVNPVQQKDTLMLGNLAIEDARSIVRARNKLRTLTENLHFTSMDVARLTTLFSDLFRALLQTDKTANVEVMLAKRDEVYGLLFGLRFYKYPLPYSAESLKMIFDNVCINQEENLTDVQLFKFITVPGFQPTDAFINNAREDLKHRTEEEMMRELILARDAAEEANLSKSNFLSSMSHELRTPLNAIIGYSEMLQEEAEKLEQKTFSDDLLKIQAAGKHLLGLINDILDLSKIEAGKLELDIETFSVADLINEIINTAQPLVEKKNNTLEVMKTGKLGEMKSDQTKVRQVLFNLLSNAAKFTEQGKITLEGSREAIDDREWLTFIVSDTGIGIDSEQLNRVFEQFTQADTTTTRKYGGTGLGLPICRKLCQLMHGDISVRSEPDKGSTFTVRLPAQLQLLLQEGEEPEVPGTQESLEDTQALSDSGEESKTRITNKESAGMAKILIIEDDVVSRDMLVKRLDRRGYEVMFAENGQEGFERATAESPDVILMDICMPEMDGLEVTRRLKKDKKTQDIPVIVLTALALKREQGEALAAGCDDYEVKPIDFPRLLEKIERSLGR